MSRSKADQVKESMRATGQFSDDELKAITDDSINEAEKNAQSVPIGSYPADARPAYTTWSGNNFQIISGVWYWQDKIGSQCGRDRWWKYTPAVGASYQQKGSCPQGYVWYEMHIT
ncbi:MAG: hypothetical protein ABR577_16395 [Pyrinomonadaceae bacterium]